MLNCIKKIDLYLNSHIIIGILLAMCLALSFIGISYIWMRRHKNAVTKDIDRLARIYLPQWTTLFLTLYISTILLEISVTISSTATVGNGIKVVICTILIIIIGRWCCIVEYNIIVVGKLRIPPSGEKRKYIRERKQLIKHQMNFSAVILLVLGIFVLKNGMIVSTILSLLVSNIFAVDQSIWHAIKKSARTIVYAIRCEGKSHLILIFLLPILYILGSSWYRCLTFILVWLLAMIALLRTKKIEVT